MRKENSTPVVRSTRFNRANLPPPSAFYKQELGQLGRADSRGWVRCKQKCFNCGHGGFGVNLRSGGFYCLSCGVKGGDVLAFYMLRYRVDFVTAYRRLGACEDDPNPAESRRRREQEAERRAAEATCQEQVAEAARRERIEARDWLHLLERSYVRHNDRLTALRHQDHQDLEQHAGEVEVLWSILADLLAQIRTAASDYRQLAGVADGD